MTTAQDRITAFWSTVAEGYETYPGNVEPVGTPEYQAWVSVIQSALPASPARVLDVATGTGFAALIAAAGGHHVTGIDLAEPMLEVAREHTRQRALDIEFALGDALQPPFPPESFDIVMSRHLLWTLRQPEVAFENWRRLLRPRGFVLAIDGLWELPVDDAVTQLDPENVFAVHYTPDTMSALPIQRIGTFGNLARMFSAAGFVDVSVEELTQLPPPEDGPATRYLARANRP
jgi:ubiquinone/menaquinone biosynthesis C-methylase UbiE